MSLNFPPYNGRIITPFPDDAPHLQLLMFGAYSIDAGTLDWSLNTLQTTENLNNRDTAILFCRLGEIARITNTPQWYAPAAAECNAEVVMSSAFGTKISSDKYPDFTLHRGVKADGVVLTSGTGCFQPTGDCPVIVVCVRGTKFALFAHAGRESLYDASALTGSPRRSCHSVVDNIVAFITGMGLGTHDVLVYTGGAIAPEHFTHPPDHPEYGPKNRQMIQHFKQYEGGVPNPDQGTLDLKEIIRQQFLGHGVPYANIYVDTVDTYSDTFSDGSYQWHSARRAYDHGKPTEDRMRRNLMALVNHAPA